MKRFRFILLISVYLFFGFQPINNIIKDEVVTSPPTKFKLDPFYKKYIDANGIPVISSGKVPDIALIKAAEVVKMLISELPLKVKDTMIKQQVKLVVMARYEGTTDIPEYAFLAHDTTINWDVRARGLGGTPELPLTSCAEENVLCYQIDKYHAEDILIHEFAHTIHLVGIVPNNPEFNEMLQEMLDKALANGKWHNTYASTNYEEYWAEGVQCWFNVNAEVEVPDGKHNHINTREELRVYDPDLYKLIKNYFTTDTVNCSCHYNKQ